MFFDCYFVIDVARDRQQHLILRKGFHPDGYVIDLIYCAKTRDREITDVFAADLLLSVEIAGMRKAGGKEKEMGNCDAVSAINDR